MLKAANKSQSQANTRQYGDGKEIAQRLERNNLITNYQALPHDKSFTDPSGIRMGVQEMTGFGMVEKDFETLAGYVADVIRLNKDVKNDVTRFRSDFREMKYCLEPNKAAVLAAQLLNSILPGDQFARTFADHLYRATRP